MIKGNASKWVSGVRLGCRVPVGKGVGCGVSGTGRKGCRVALPQNSCLPQKSSVCLKMDFLQTTAISSGLGADDRFVFLKLNARR